MKGLRMERRFKIIGIHVALILLIVAGCTRPYNEFSGPARPTQDIAVVTPDNGVRIHALDAKVINTSGGITDFWVKYDRLQLRPGEYTLTLIPQGIETVKTFTRLTVAVEAGKRYRVRSQFYSGTSEARGYYKFWVENELTGVVISEIVESRNPFQTGK